MPIAEAMPHKSPKAALKCLGVEAPDDEEDDEEPRKYSTGELIDLLTKSTAESHVLSTELLARGMERSTIDALRAPSATGCCGP